MSHQNQSPHSQDQLDLVYGLNDRPKPIIAFLAAFQHLLAIIVPIVTPGLLICLALGVSKEDTNMILSMSLVISGIATFLQCKKVGPFGAGLLIVQGTSFNFIGPIIGIGSAMVAAGTPVESVMAAIFGVVIAGSFIEMGVSRILPWVKMLITPLVTGIVVLLIGLTLIKEGLISMGGGYQAMSNNTFANADNLIMSCTVLGLIILLNRIRITWVKSSAILIALVVGYVLAGFMGHLDFSGLKDAPLIQVPTPMHFGIDFSWSLFIPMAFIYLVTSLDANSFLAGIFNTFPSSVFAQNNGVIQLTGVASRYVGIWIAALLVILGLLPAVAGVIQAVPQAVLGGAVMVMFGAVAASGINILSGVHLDRRALLIIAISLALGLGVAQVPQILEHLPELFRNIFSSGVATGGIAALILNIVLPETKK